MALLKNPQALQLYRELLSEAARFPQYNYRMYALRKIRDEFEAHKNIDTTLPASDPSSPSPSPCSPLAKLLASGQKELERLRRMTTIAALYSHTPLVIEEEK